MTFQIHSVTAEPFKALFALSEAELKERRITRCYADADQGFPCRISLSEATKGDELLLLNYEHLALASPYRASHAIYVAKNSHEAALAEDEIPQSLKLRPLSLRAFGPDGNMREADLADQTSLSERLNDMLSTSDVAFVHIHNAKQGCYAALVTRPGEFKPEWRGALAQRA